MLGYAKDILDDFCNSRTRAIAAIDCKDLLLGPLIVGGAVLMSMILVTTIIARADKVARKAEKITTQAAVTTNVLRTVQLER